MKTSLIFACLALTGCTAFTAPKDPVTGIRQDAPPEWVGTPDPRDTPETIQSIPESEGNFGHGWMNR